MDSTSAEQAHIEDMSSAEAEQVRLRDLPLEDREKQTRYWGIAEDDDLARCPTCAQQGHMAATCKARNCQHCRTSNKHFSSDCPRWSKCSRCRERGHDVSTCTSKLARSVGDGLDCDFCHGNHGEELCSWLWRTFRPSSIPGLELNKVDRLPVFCYNCASATHLGDDCVQRPIQQANESTNDIFSANFANKFLLNPIQPDISALDPARTQQQPSLEGERYSFTPTRQRPAQTRQSSRPSLPTRSRRGRKYGAVPPPRNL